MPQSTFPCPSCESVFPRKHQLRKHAVRHSTPDRLHRCTECNFITLDRRNLKIHFATHTGEQGHSCPHMINTHDESGAAAHQVQCPYRTHDPSLLTKHRKKAHGYIPQARTYRSRPAGGTLLPPPIPTPAPLPTAETTTSVQEPQEVVETNVGVNVAQEYDFLRGQNKAKSHTPQEISSEDDGNSLFSEDTSRDATPIASGPSEDAGPSSTQDQSTQDIPLDRNVDVTMIPPQQDGLSSYTAVYDPVTPIGAEQDVQDEDEGSVANAAYSWFLSGRWPTYITQPDQGNFYERINAIRSQWDVTGPYENTTPDTAVDTTHMVAEPKLLLESGQDTQDQSVYETGGTPVILDQDTSHPMLEPALNAGPVDSSALVTQLPSMGSTTSLTSPEDVEDYRCPYPGWLPRAFWDDIWAPLKGRDLTGTGDAESSVRVGEEEPEDVEDYRCPYPGWLPRAFWDDIWAPLKGRDLTGTGNAESSMRTDEELSSSSFSYSILQEFLDGI